MSTNQSYLWTNGTNPLHHQKFNLNEIAIYRNGQPVVGTSISTTSDQRVYFNTLKALVFLDKGGHGFPLANYPNHIILAFDLTSTQEASHDFIHRELTNCLFSLKLTFGTISGHNVEILFLGEGSSTFYVNSERKLRRTWFLDIRLMKNFEISYLVSKCFHLKHKFCGVFAEFLKLRIFQDCQIIALLWSVPQYQHHQVVIGYWFVIINKKRYTLLIHLGRHQIATILYTLERCSSTSKKKLFNSSDYNQFRTQTQNCVESFVFILLILFSHIAIRMLTTWMMMI